MELVKNKASGKSFIVLNDTADAYFVLITPEGKFKRLKRHLFDPQHVVEPRPRNVNTSLQNYRWLNMRNMLVNKGSTIDYPDIVGFNQLKPFWTRPYRKGATQ